MDNKGIHSVIDMIREASKKDLILVSLILLPIILGEWANFLNVFDLFKQNSCYKLAAIIVVFVFYVFGLILMKCWDSPEEKHKRARHLIENRLKNKPGHRASFKNIRESVNPKYDDNFLRKLIDKNPIVFRPVRIKKYGAGIALVEEQPDDEQ